MYTTITRKKNVIMKVKNHFCFRTFIQSFRTPDITFDNLTSWSRWEILAVLFRFSFFLMYATRCCLVAQSCLTLCDLMECGTPGFPVLHHLPELAQTPVRWVHNAIQPSHPLSSPSPPAFYLCQYQGLFQWAGSSHQVAKVLELQLQHLSFQWIFRTDFL